MFEDNLIASRKQKRNTHQLLVLPIALLLHVVVITGFLVAQVWQIADVPEPPLQVSFFSAPPPPPPAAAPPKAAAAPKIVAPTAPQQIVQPVAIPDKIPEKPTTGDNEGVAGGVEGGVEGGEAGGIPGGVVGGAVGGSAPVPIDEAPIRIGGEVVAPEIITRVQPIYPEIARKARVQGVVIVEAIIDRQGNVTDVRPLRNLPMGVTEAALEAIRKWKYRPATLNGRNVSVYLTVTVTFTLQ